MSETAKKKLNHISDTLSYLRKLFKPEQCPFFLLVGGAVRDSICGVTIDDVDLVSELPEATLLKQGFRRVEGKSTAPILFKSDPVLGKIEITIIGSLANLEKNLIARDFRCNAVAMTMEGTLIDPLGGRQEIIERTLSPCSNRSLMNDPLRVFRAFRFECDGWQISPELANTLRFGQWNEHLAKIPVERFTREMLKAMSCTSPGFFFRSMLEYGIGENFLPELFKMQKVPAGPPAYHGTDSVYTHSLAALNKMAAMTSDSTARLAAFFHDIGKLSTAIELLPRHIGHDLAGAEAARLLAIRLNLSAYQRNALIAASRLHMTGGLWDRLRSSTRLKLASQALKYGISGFFPLLVASDHGTSPVLTGWDEAIRTVSLSATELGLDVSDFENIPAQKRASLISQARLSKFKQLQDAYSPNDPVPDSSSKSAQ